MDNFRVSTIEGNILVKERYDCDTNETFFDCYLNNVWIGEAYGETKEEVIQYIKDNVV